MKEKVDWNELKLRTGLYLIKCCPSCGAEHEHLFPNATGPTWTCQKCYVKFTVNTPSYLKRKGKTNDQNRN